MKNRKLLTYNVSVVKNRSIAGQFMNWRDLHIEGDLSDGGKYSFGFLVGSVCDAKTIYGLFKAFCIQKNIIY